MHILILKGSNIVSHGFQPGDDNISIKYALPHMVIN